MRNRSNVRRGLATMLLALAFAAPALAQFPEDKGPPDNMDPELKRIMERDPQFKNWAYLAQVSMPDKAGANAYAQLEVPSDIIARSQPSLNDLRLADAQGQRVPFVLQTFSGERRQAVVHMQRVFNSGVDSKSGGFQESIELAPVSAPGHNEIEIRTAGVNFRRRVKLEGADNEKFENALSILPADSFVYRFETPEGKIVESSTLRYDYKQFRFLRVLVIPDANIKNDAPKIESVTVRQTIVREGEDVTRPLDKGFSERQPVAAAGGPGSAWYIDLGQTDFVSSLTFRADKAADRTIQLKVAERGQPPFDIFGLDASWQKDKDGQMLLVLRFPEVRARRFQLVITDFANDPLHITPLSYSAAKRRLVFETPAKLPQPFQLFFGNHESGPPGFDLEKTLPAKLDPPPAEASLFEVQDNPFYEKPVPPFHERHRWAVVAVLTAASLVLLGLLVSLARQIKPGSGSLLGDVGQAK